MNYTEQAKDLQELFNYMVQDHNVTMLEQDMFEVLNICRRIDTPQPIKVDAETGEELECPTSQQRGQSAYGFKKEIETYQQAPTPLEFIKRQKEKDFVHYSKKDENSEWQHYRIDYSEANHFITNVFIKHQDQIQQLKSKADRDRDGYDKDRIEMMDKIAELKDEHTFYNLYVSKRTELQQANKELTELKEGNKLNFYKKLQKKLNKLMNGELDLEDYSEEVYNKIERLENS